jgi:predicted anti-sigma-YlaC factor YlaD
MTCDELRAYLDATLAEDHTPEILEQVQQHVAACPSCAEYLADMATVEQQLRALPPFKPDAKLLQTVMAQVRHKKPASAAVAQTVGDMLRWAALVLSAVITTVAMYRGSSIGEWFFRLSSWHVRPVGLTSSLLQPPPAIMLVYGLAAILAAVAILGQDSSDDQPAATPR